MWFVMSPEAGLLIAAVIIGWWIVQGVKSASKSFSLNEKKSSEYRPHSVNLPAEIVNNKRCKATNAKFQPYIFYKYSVDVHCPELSQKRHLLAPTYEHLLLEIDKAFKKFEAELDES